MACMAGPISCMRIVPRSVISVMTTALDLSVRRSANWNPCLVAVSEPIEKMGIPGEENGRKNQRKTMKRFTTSRRRKISIGSNRARTVSTREKTRAVQAVSCVSTSAMGTVSRTAQAILALGSER